MSTLEDAVPPAPTLETFNRWCVQYYGAPIDEDEWDAFSDFGVFSELRREDCSDQAIIEVFFIWRNSDEYERYQIDLQPIDYDAQDSPSPAPLALPPEQPHAPQSSTLPAIEELPPSSLPLWPQPTWQNARRDESPPYFQMVFTDADTTHFTVAHAGCPTTSPARRCLAESLSAGRDPGREVFS